MNDAADSASPPGWRSLLGGGNTGRVTVIAGGVALHAVSIYVVATILPMVVRDVGGLPFFAWTATLYIAGSLTGAASVPLAVSRVGMRRGYQLGFAVFMVGSLVCAVAHTMPVLLAGRLVQGFGGGMLPALGYATIRVVFPPALHARAISLLGTVWGAAALLGPAVGGVFAQWNAWRWAFGVDLLIGLGFALVAQRVLPAHAPGGMVRGFPGLRLGLLAAAAVAVSAGGVAGAALPALAGIAVAVLLVVAMLRLDGRTAQRLLPTGAFNPAVALGAVSATMGLLIIATTPGTFVPYLLSVEYGVEPITGGYASALIALSWTATSLLTAGAAGPAARRTILLGPWAMVAGLLVNAWSLGGGWGWGVVAGQLLIGGGIGVCWAHLAALLMRVALPAERDIAGPFVSATQTLSAAFGSAIAGMVANLAGLAEAVAPGPARHMALVLFAALAIAPVAAGLTALRALHLTRAG